VEWKRNARSPVKDSGQWWEYGSPTLPLLALLSSLPRSSSTEGSMLNPAPPPHERLVVFAPVPIAGHDPGNAGTA